MTANAIHRSPSTGCADDRHDFYENGRGEKQGAEFLDSVTGAVSLCKPAREAGVLLISP